MGFLLVGLLFLVLKYLEIGFVASWSWWWVMAPFVLAFVYWEVVDPYFGISKKRASRQIDERKQARIDKLKAANQPHLKSRRHK